MKIDTLDALSPLDGRYEHIVRELGRIFGERGLAERRVWTGARYVLALSEEPLVIHLRELKPKEKVFLQSLHVRARKDARVIKQYEKKGRKGKKATNHDVTATIAYMKEMFARTSLGDVTGWIHFALTSEDINNIAYALQLRDGIEKVIIPALKTLWRGIDTSLLRAMPTLRSLP